MYVSIRYRTFTFANIYHSIRIIIFIITHRADQHLHISTMDNFSNYIVNDFSLEKDVSALISVDSPLENEFNTEINLTSTKKNLDVLLTRNIEHQARIMSELSTQLIRQRSTIDTIDSMLLTLSKKIKK